MPDSKLKEREREAQMRALREELEAEMEEKLMETPLLPSSLEGGRVGMRGETADIGPKRVIEALLFSSGKPLTASEIKKAVSGVSAREIQEAITELREEYEREKRSFELIEIAGGWQMVTRKAYAAWLTRLEQQKKARQATQSALETLAILAYKQPVTRAEIETLRGVDVSAVLSTLLERGFIKITGKKEVAGRPFLYGTTDKFLEHFGLKALVDLPQIAEIKTLVERAVKKEEHESQGPAGEN